MPTDSKIAPTDSEIAPTDSEIAPTDSEIAHRDYAEENALFFMLGPRGGPRFFYSDVINIF